VTRWRLLGVFLQVLVRLKVDYTGFSQVSNTRFGKAFVGKVANPADILIFHKQKKKAENDRQGPDHCDHDDDDDDDDDDGDGAGWW
jgi:hypothetical protein